MSSHTWIVFATTAAILFSPHALPYDTVLLAVPAWLSFVLHRMNAIPSPAPAWLAVAVALVLDLGSPLVSLAPVVLLGGLVWGQPLAVKDDARRSHC